jgi:hypothetical protein
MTYTIGDRVSVRRDVLYGPCQPHGTVVAVRDSQWWLIGVKFDADPERTYFYQPHELHKEIDEPQ